MARQIHDLLAPAAVAALRREIAEAGGREVLAVARMGRDGRATEITVVARGHEQAVLVPGDVSERGDLLIHNHPSGTLSPSDADMAVSSRFAEVGVGSAIVDNAVESIYVVVEPMPPHEAEPLDPEELVASLSAGGAFARSIPGFAARAAQTEMLRAVVTAFNDDGIVAAEAGTGVGKSFAYLVPAVVWATTNRERVVISTATITLQQQLVDRDIPAVAAALALDVRVALVKGRGNYLCWRRLREAGEEAELIDDDDADWLAPIVAWAETSPTGARNDTPEHLRDDRWNRINSEADTCSAARCPNRERCFVTRARRDAAGAQLIVANHHIVFSDIAVRRAGVGWDGTALLPAYTRLIFDEAHAVERAATSFFSQETSIFAIRRQVQRLLRQRKGRRFGILDRLPAFDIPAPAVSAVERLIGELEARVRELNRALVRLVGDDATWRLTVPERAAYDRVAAGALEDARVALGELADRLAAMLRQSAPEHRDDPILVELAALARRFAAMESVLADFADRDGDGGLVRWLERRRSGDESWVRIVLTPLQIASILRESLLDRHETIVFASATLAIGDSFAFWGERLGIDPEDARVSCGQYPSPFDYRSRVLTAVPADAPDPNAPHFDAYLGRLVEGAVAAARGGALLLFTSFRQLDLIFNAVTPSLEERGYVCLRQGSDDRSRLLDRFRGERSSVLFATDSFWEGVDVPGESLRLVVICRLPFRVPTDPVQIARAEAIERDGGNAFAALSLPQAVMRFKQGFGRLMRRVDDSGAVLVADPRIIRKRYGEAFWASIPETRRAIEATDATIDEIAYHLARDFD